MNKDGVGIGGLVFMVCVIIVAIIMYVFMFKGCSDIFLKESDDEIYRRGYVDACNDFYEGKLKYQLFIKEDGTKEWRKIENVH